MNTRPAPGDGRTAPPFRPSGLLAGLSEGGRPLGAFLLLALGIKVIVIMAALGDDPLASHPTSDSLYYLERAAGIAGLIDDPLADEPHHLPPLYPQLLARVPGVLDGSFGGVYLLQALFGTAALAAVYLLARRRAGRLPALGAAALTLLYGPSTFFEVKLLGDSLACSLLLFALLVTDRIADRTTDEPAATRGASAWGMGVVLGLLLALATLLRPQIILLIPVLLVWLAVRRARTAALACGLAAALLLSPSTLHNLQTGGGLTPTSDNGGVNLWLANAGPLSGTFLTHEEAFGDIARQATSARALAEEMAGRSLDPGEVSDTLRGAAWQAVLADPLRFGTRLRLRAQALLESFETGIVCVPEVEGQLMGPLAVLAMPFGVILALGGAALVILARRPRRFDGTPPGEPPLAPVWPMFAVAGLVVLTTLLFFHYSRFRLPLIPLLAVSAAAAVDRLQHRRVGAGRATLAVLTAGALAWISWLPGSHHQNTRAIGWTSLAEARIARATRDDREQALLAADQDVQRALSHAPTLVRARLQAHRVALGLGRFDEAAEHLDAVEVVLPDHSQLLMNRAWLSVWQDPRNAHYDLLAARELVDRLALAALLDPELAPHVQQLQARLTMLEAQPPRDASEN